MSKPQMIRHSFSFAKPEERDEFTRQIHNSQFKTAEAPGISWEVPREYTITCHPRLRSQPGRHYALDVVGFLPRKAPPVHGLDCPRVSGKPCTCHHPECPAGHGDTCTCDLAETAAKEPAPTAPPGAP